MKDRIEAEKCLAANQALRKNHGGIRMVRAATPLDGRVARR
jgi:hypothetical protein